MNFLQRWWQKLKGLIELHPELADREHVLSIRSDDYNPAANSYQQAADDYAHYIWVQKAVNVWAHSIGPLPLQIVNENNEAQSTHPLLLLLRSPNPMMPASDFWRTWAINMALGGECGLEFVRNGRGKFVSMYAREADYFAVRPSAPRSRYGEVAAYVMDYNESSSYNLSPDEFLHFKFHNPLNPWRGIAPHTAVRLAIVIDQLVQGWSRTFFANSARPDYAVIAPQGLTIKEREDIEAKLAAKFGGTLQGHKPIVLEAGVTDIKTFSFGRRDLEWIQQKRLARDEVGAVWGVPDEIMGFGKDTYNNFDIAERVVWSITLLPIVQFRDDHLTHWFHSVGVLSDDLRIRSDLSRVWALRRASAVQINDALKLFSMGVPFNTIDRVLGLGVGEIPGGDVSHFNVVPPSDTVGDVEGQQRLSAREWLEKFSRVEHGGNGHGKSSL